MLEETLATFSHKSSIMRAFIVIICLTIGVNAIPISSPVEDESKSEFLEPEWALVPDAEGGFHFVNINEDPEPDFFFDAARDVIFTLFTRANRNGVIIPLNSAAAITSSTFNSQHPTRFLIHGWHGDISASTNQLIIPEYLDRGDFNVFVVDWGAGAQTINYLAARNRVGDVGAVTAQMINFLNTQTGMLFSSVSVIGHSLGGHTAGLAGKSTRELLGAVVALDPAGPLFFFNRPSERVDATDANYVEIIYTNAGTLGFDEPIGDANFYPNWGSSQPGCILDIAGTCAHERSNIFFAESINSNIGFRATQCRGYNDILTRNCVSSGPTQLMGGEPPNTASRGVYFLQTNSNRPFARG